jgi:phage gpG-like protein
VAAPTALALAAFTPGRAAFPFRAARPFNNWGMKDMSVFTLAEFAANLAAADVALDVGSEIALAKSCAMLSGAAKDLIGVPHDEWPPLAPATLAHKDGVNTPLLETGEMRDSITWNSDEHEGYVGSNNKKLVWNELGTSHIPPRPVLGLALTQNEHKVERLVEKEVGRAIGAALGGVGSVFRELREAGHYLHKAGEDVNEMIHDDGQDERRR